MSLCDLVVSPPADGGDGIVVKVLGEVDMSGAPHLLGAVLCAALAHPGSTIVLDLDEVTFMDSSGIRAVVEAERRLRDQQAHLVVARPQRNVRRVFDITGVDSVLDIREA